VKIAVVLNPNALGVRRAPGLADRLRAVLDGAGEVVVTRTSAELAAAARRFAGDGVALVAVCGGDGTNLSTLTELVRAYGPARVPTFAILRGGTVNTIAGNLGIRGRPHEVLARLVGAVRAGQVPTVGQDLLEVNGLHGFLFASLMGARFLEAYYGGMRPGPAWAAILAARTVASSLLQGHFARWLFAPAEVELTVDGERVADARFRLLVASVVRDVGIGMKVTWRAGLAERRFHLVASGLSTTSMALQLHKVLAGRPLGGAPHLDRLAERVRLQFAQPQTYTLDGDLFRAKEVEIAIGPRVAIARP
jgi:diacylglycerol kinase family enzyme